jgi:hypothetical protein
LIIFLKNSRLNSEEVRIIVIHFSQSTFFDNIFEIVDRHAVKIQKLVILATQFMHR